MKAQNRIDCAPRYVVLLGLLALASSALAQEVIAPPPAVPTAPPGVLRVKPAGTQATEQSEAVPAVPEESLWLQEGLLRTHPHLFYRLLYGEGIQSARGQPVSTTIQSFAPGVTFTLGDHWNLDYTPTWTFYSNNTFRDTFDQAASLAGGYTSADSSAGFSLSYLSASPVLIETGQQTHQVIYATGLNASRRLGSRTLLDMGLSWTDRSADTFTSSRESSVSAMLHYQFSARVNAAAGLSAGYVNVSAGSDMTDTRPQVQIAWRPTDKVSVDAHGGVENRRFRAGGVSDLNNPFYGAAIRYQPVANTALTLGADRVVAPSYFAGLVTETTSWQAGLEQRLLEHFYLSAGFAQGKNSYIATENGVVAGRDDRYYSFNVRLHTTWLRRGTIAVLYQNTHNTSNLSGFGFDSNQIGLEIGYRF